jgi:hypothetical protein
MRLISRRSLAFDERRPDAEKLRENAVCQRECVLSERDNVFFLRERMCFLMREAQMQTSSQRMCSWGERVYEQR